jgi:hypothetical protein
LGIRFKRITDQNTIYLAFLRQVTNGNNKMETIGFFEKIIPIEVKVREDLI